LNDVTRILSTLRPDDPAAASQLLALVYDELRKLAARRMASERPGQTLQATALVHEAYLRLVNAAQPQQWNGRGHFFAAAAEAMRRILVEKARHRQRLRHGGGWRRVQLDQMLETTHTLTDDGPASDLLGLDEVLTQLAAEEPEAAEVVKLRYFAGLTVEQAADALGISVRTTNRNWAYAKAWLYKQLSGRRG
jgi:RNA polymerase sigma factor (TIGR02999 family)